MNPSLILGVMAILCLLVACGVTIKGFGVGAEGATRRSQVLGAVVGALMFAALAWFTWPSKGPSPSSLPSASALPTETPLIDVTRSPSKPEPPTEALSIPTPAGQWYAGVKYPDELDYPKYAFTYQLTFDSAGQLQPRSSWWKDSANDIRRQIRSGSLLGEHLSLLYDSPNGSPITLEAKLVERQAQSLVFDTILTGARNGRNLPPSERKISVQVVLYLEREP